MTEPNARSHLDDPDPPALDDGRWERIRSRSRAIARRRRVTLTTAGTAAVVAVILVAAGLALVGRNQGDGVVTVGGSSSTPRSPTPTDRARSTTSITGRGVRPPQPKPCPVPSPEPSMATGQYCGPLPPPGNGLGPNGECTGRETAVPCAAGVIPGHYYAFTLPGRCDGVIVFDGRRWISELPPPKKVPDFDVWMRLDPNGGLGFIGPNGAVGFDPDTGQARGACSQ